MRIYVHTHAYIHVCTCIYLLESLLGIRQYASAADKYRDIKVGCFMQGNEHAPQSKREQNLF